MRNNDCIEDSDSLKKLAIQLVSMSDFKQPDPY